MFVLCAAYDIGGLKEWGGGGSVDKGSRVDTFYLIELFYSLDTLGPWVGYPLRSTGISTPRNRWLSRLSEASSTLKV